MTDNKSGEDDFMIGLKATPEMIAWLNKKAASVVKVVTKNKKQKPKK